MKKTTPTTKSSLSLKLKLNRETLHGLDERGLQEAAGGSSHFCHSGVSITFCC